MCDMPFHPESDMSCHQCLNCLAICTVHLKNFVCKLMLMLVCG